MPDETPDAAGREQLDPSQRGGEDNRRRGWFWHWNSLVTQYAPLIGLKGVGLLNSYTVWTDRREDSPHRGYAFPSQQSEANFYGEDRAELITINKILVALDLIEIRKEMVLHVDDKGRRWRVPHNLYRVKDQASGFNLTIDDVLRVVELAARDRAVYRYIRRVFSANFAPIDRDNVWHQILPLARQTETWQRLAAKVEREDAKASARSKAGHRSRNRRASGGSKQEKRTRQDDSSDAQEDARRSTQAGSAQTSVARDNTGSSTGVASPNTGFATSADQSNNGLEGNGATIDGNANQGGQTFVDPANSTYYQDSTTTTTTTVGVSSTASDGPVPSALHPRPLAPPASGAGPVLDASARALAAFEAANDRPATPLERELLSELERDFADVAHRSGTTSAAWLADAIKEAVNSGSRFVAPKRVREILSRWSRAAGNPLRPGSARPESPVVINPALAAASPGSSEAPDGDSTNARKSEVKDMGTDAKPRRKQPGPRQASQESPAHGAAPLGRESEPESSAPVESAPRSLPAARFSVAPGLSSAQVWAAAQTDLAERLTSANFETWIRPATLIGRDPDDSLVVGVPSRFAQQRVAARLREPIESALAAIIGQPVNVNIVVTQEWLRRQGTSATSAGNAEGAEERAPE